MNIELIIKNKQDKTLKARLRKAYKEAPEIKKIFENKGYTDRNCKNCFHKKTKSCKGLKPLSLICRSWYWPGEECLDEQKQLKIKFSRYA